MGYYAVTALTLTSLALTSGCSGVAVRPVTKFDQLGAAWKASIAGKELSPRTLQTLRRFDLETVYHRRSEQAFIQLQSLAGRDPQPDTVFALAEMAYLLGRRAEGQDCATACCYYYLCSGYAYHFLFDFPSLSGVEGVAVSNAASMDLPVTSAYDPRFRLACDLYNGGLANLIRAAQKVGRLDPRQELRLPGPDGKGLILSVVQIGFLWQPEEFGPLLFCNDFEVVGLENHYRTYGLGVPLMGTRAAASNAAPGHAFYPREVCFPVTAFFRFEGTLADLGARRAGWLELYNPLARQNVTVQGRPVPLETDLTTPLAYFLDRTDLEGIEYLGFLNADKVQKRSGIYLFEPYQAGKIPVLMVHGLLSSPLTWTPMFNDLRADPVLRDRYQFWFYLYPTSQPYLDTAANLRDALDRLRAELDPEHHDSALDHLVCVGHSMGGLVSKLLTVDSGDDFRCLVSARPFADLPLQPTVREELQRVFYFQRRPAVERVVFLGTPHHGSKLSPSSAGRLLNRVAGLPKEFLQATGDLVQVNATLGLAGNGGSKEPLTSIELLEPGAPALELLAARSKPPGVHYHSIIGNAAGNDTLRTVAKIFSKTSGRTDGVVPYESAHLDGVDSELVVEADHTHVHQHPLAVLEVRRILLEHLRSAEGSEIIPASLFSSGKR
jgi:pimeloyl-ACP methyl ester carboxylesterase